MQNWKTARGGGLILPLRTRTRRVCTPSRISLFMIYDGLYSKDRNSHDLGNSHHFVLIMELIFLLLLAALKDCGEGVFILIPKHFFRGYTRHDLIIFF